MAAGILNHVVTAGQALAGSRATPMADATNGANGSSGTNGTGNPDSGSSATISANDFLTLLVTEMQNQDPTANMDPNQYIDQLVQVNSLEQLININQTLSGALGSTSPSSGATKQGSVTTQPLASTIAGAMPNPAASSALPAGEMERTRGNLSVPNPSAAAERVGHALDGSRHARAATAAPVALR
jgi:flagellar basal-body rod modification protein FlgD